MNKSIDVNNSKLSDYPDGYLEPLDLEMPLDKGIELYVLILRKGNVETYESCEGGEGHAYPEPTIRFLGSAAAGFHAYSVARDHALPVKSISRGWDDIDGELTGPHWQMTFWKKVDSA